MKRHMKKLSALALALVLMLTAAAPVMAAGEKPSANDTAAVTVKNVESGMTVKAYQVVKANYSSDGFTGYAAVEGVSIANVNNPTAEEIAKIAQNASSLGTPVTLAAQTDGTYTGNLNAGSWMILVTGTDNAKIYNPMLVSVSYISSGSDNTTAGGTVDANSNWTLNGEVVYAKSSDPAPKKIIVNPDSNNEKGDDVAVGDVIEFQITAQIPSYNEVTYKNPTFSLTDTLSDGLTFEGTPTVTIIGDGNITADDYTLTTSGQVLSLTLSSDYVMANGLKTITVSYSAKLNNNAAINASANNNNVVLTYSNSPTTTTTADDKVYVYTFGLDSSLTGTMNIPVGQPTHELVKVAADEYDEQYKSYDEWVEAGSPGALADATFKLTSKTNSSVSYTSTSDKNGALAFKGLDAGEYTLVETEAPEGYTVDSTEHSVVITAQYNENGTLDSYSVTIDGDTTSTYKAHYTGTGTKITLDKVIEEAEGTTKLMNTKLAQLPSTGGMGTYLFTIIGVAVMAVAAGLFLARRRRQA